MSERDVCMCVRHGADIVGFVVNYPCPVPWDIDIELARELIARTPKPAKTCVVTGGAPDKIIHIAKETKPEYVQLHSAETLGDTLQLVRELGKYGIKIIKAVSPDMPDLEKSAVDFCEAGVYALLIDSRTHDNVFASNAVDVDVFVRLKRSVNCTVILAGGINPENVSEIIHKTGAQAIDLMTGAERSYGIKDEKKVKALFGAI